MEDICLSAQQSGESLDGHHNMILNHIYHNLTSFLLFDKANISQLPQFEIISNELNIFLCYIGCQYTYNRYYTTIILIPFPKI